jgi:hypothetical protein
MIIHPLWLLCVLTRFSIIIIIRHLVKTIKNKKLTRNVISSILLAIGLGFMYKAISGSNNEVQVNKVFWHETRYVHGTLYILSSIYLFNNNLDMCSLVLLTDLLFSILYRFIHNK